MKLYMHPVSMTSRPVRLFIAESGIEIEQQMIDLMAGEHHQEPFISINPNRLVPVLDDGDLRLTESRRSSNTSPTRSTRRPTRRTW